jgi:hypothetical protein
MSSVRARRFDPRDPQKIATILKMVDTNGFRFAAAYGLTRFVLALYGPARRFPTSWQYRWQGASTTRPYGVAVLFSLAQTPTGIVFLQTLIAVGCWIWFFRETMRALGWRNKFAIGLVGAVAIASLSAPVALWDRTLLPESLKFSSIVCFAASWMMLQRRRGDRLSVAACLSAFGFVAFVSSVLFLLIAVPIAAATTYRVWRWRGVAFLAAAVIVLGTISILPSTVASGPVKASALAERSMNIVGTRILPDASIRRQFTSSGLPKTSKATLYRERTGAAENWLLFRDPQIRSFAESFPLRTYIWSTLRRPGVFLSDGIHALEGASIVDSKDIGLEGTEVVPRSLSNPLWGWSGPFHLLVVFLMVAGFGTLTGSGPRGPKRFVRGALWLAIVPTIGAALSVFTGEPDGNRDRLVLLTVSRLALVVTAATIAATWIRHAVEVDRNGIHVTRFAIGPERIRISPAVRMGILGITLIGAIVTIFSSISAKDDGPRISGPRASADLVRTVEKGLRNKNIVLSQRVRNMLPALLSPWEKRDDLKASLSYEDGTPNVEALTQWARGFPDSSTESFARHLGAIDELRSRLGLLSPDTGITPVLYWTLKNEPRLEYDYTNVFGHLSDYWNVHPDVQNRFLANGRVDVVAFLKEANAIEESDPLARNVKFDFFVVREAIRQLEQPNG